MISNTFATLSAMGSSGIEIEHLSSLPCHVYWKDKNSTYLGYNDFGAKRLGLKEGKKLPNTPILKFSLKTLPLNL